jgi:hypothetical protein
MYYASGAASKKKKLTEATMKHADQIDRKQ